MSPKDQGKASSKQAKRHPTVVGIGASAGGLAALKTFFEHVPVDSGVAFVVIVHLSPEHESFLPDLLQPHTTMPVQQVQSTVGLKPDHVYVIPPNANLESIDTHLRLSKLEEPRQKRAPIDHFFRTLARTHEGSAIGVILTGTGSDGALGVKEIKERHGLAVVQDPSEAEYDGMPQSAIATGLVDLVLPVAKIPAAVMRYAWTDPRIEVPEGEEVPDELHQTLQKLFALVRARTGRDFSRYKRSTILRRIGRRMQLHEVEELPAYLDLLRDQPEETLTLADDVLVTVTSFFRDPSVFEVLEKELVPKLFEGKGPDDDVRVWSVGCATGEEAYSLAILLLEEAARHEDAPRLQVFASDLHESSLGRAREGFFPGEIAVDVSAARLKRYFHQEDGGYRVRKEVREVVIFAPHNLLGDPPFSRLDLIACRNLLIYLQRDVQRDVIELFHYALRQDGFLLLGPSETVDDLQLFSPNDKKNSIYRKRNVPPPEPRLPVFPLTRLRGHEHERAPRTGEPVLYGTIHQRMVERFAPPSLLLSADDKIVHLSEHAGRYLIHPGGLITNNVYKLVREELRIELRSLVHQARERREPVLSRPIPVRFEGETTHVVLHARPELEPAQGGFTLVILDERKVGEPESQQPAPDVDPQRADASRKLEAEFHLLRQQLQTLVEEYEASQEEMQASNEELQSTNEELRSTMEELETGKEELQSMNEELQTVNQENRHKVEELGQLTSDLQNLFASTEIATLFLDRELRIMRFTPRVGDLFNMRTMDRGRPLSDITSNLSYDGLLEDASAVLARLVPIERQVEDGLGRSYLMTLLPYRASDDRIAGVVITFVDVTKLKDAEAALRRSQEQLASELAAMERLHGIVSRLLGSTDVHEALEEILGAAIEIAGAQMGHVQLLDPARGMLELQAHEGLPPELLERCRSARIGDTTAEGRAAASGKQVLIEDVEQDPRSEPYREVAARAGFRAVQATPLSSREGQLLGVLTTFYSSPHRSSERDLRILDLYARQGAEMIEHLRMTESLHQKTAELEEEGRRKEVFLAILGHELRNPLAVVDSAMKVIEQGTRAPAELQPMVSAQVAKLTSLVDDLLDLSRVTHGKIRLRKALNDLTQVVRSAAQSNSKGIHEKQQLLELALADELWVYCDAQRVEQVVTNLLSNASKNAPERSQIQLSLCREDGQAVIRVKDDGRGLRRSQLTTIFEAFAQENPGAGGLGIGLTLAKKLVELHGGSIEAESEGPGLGSVFTARIPAGTATAPEPLPSAVDGGEKLPWTGRVLIIDDACDAADMLALLLRNYGAEVACAYTGTEGLELALGWSPDAVLIDIALPDITGYEVAQRLRDSKNGDRLMLLAVTGFGDSQTEEKVRQTGFDQRLVKPVEPKKLLELLERHWDQWRA